MAMNPMQRQANNYLLIGIFGTLLITGAIIVFLAMQLMNINKEIETEKAAMKSVYVVSQNIKSGETVTYDKLKKESVSSKTVPSNALSVALEETTVAKIDLAIGTIITDNMVQDSEEKTTDDLRRQEYNMVILPTQIENGNYIDIRLRLSNGLDYIVVSKKCIEIPEIDGVQSANTFIINMTEAERLVMGNAIVEAYIDQGSLLYATTYIEPGLQKSVIPTYVPTGAIQDAINRNPNIEQEAKNALFARYNANATTRTNTIAGVLAQYEQDKVNNIEAGVQEEITKAKQERENYLQSLGGY